LLKAVALVFLAIDWLILVWLVGKAWPPLLSRIALTVVLAAIGMGSLFNSGWIVAKRRDLQAWARRPPPKSDFIRESVEEGPADAVKEAITTPALRWLLGHPVGWLGLALIPVIVTAWLTFAITTLWITGSIVVPSPPGYAAYSYAVGVFEHLAYYVFWGGLLVGSLGGAAHALVAKRGDTRSFLEVAAVAGGLLTLFVVFAGLWP
jgi:hypothetical protein